MRGGGKHKRLLRGNVVNFFHLFGYPLFFIAALEIALGVTLLRQNPRKSLVNKSVAAFSFFSAAYVLSNGICYLLASRHLNFNFFNRFAWVGWLSIPAGLQLIYFLKDEKSRTGRILGYILYPFWGLVLLLTLFTDWVEPGDISMIPFVSADGPLENPLRVIGMSMIIWIMVEITRLRKRMSGFKKAQLNYFFHGTLIFATGGALTVGLLPLFSVLNPALGAYFSFPWVVLTYYAITRHRLFDIRIIYSRILSVALVLFLLSLTQIALFKLLSPALGDSFSILLSLSVVGIFFFGTRFNRKMQHWVQRLVVQDKYDYQTVLRESINATITILGQEELLTYLVASIKKSLDVETICLSLQERGGRFSQVYGDGILKRAKQDSPLNEEMIAWLRQVNHAVVREELENEGLHDENRQVHAYLKALGAELIIPLVYKGVLKGVIMLGRKGNGEPYLQSDIDLLETLAGHAAIAIENAQLYQEAKQAKEAMRESEAKFRTLAETAANAIFIHQGGNFLYANRAGEIIGGYTVAEYLTMDFFSLVHPDYVNMIKDRARQRLIGGQAPQQYEFKIVKKGGEERWVLMTAGITEFDGKPTVIGTLIDITERKQAEEERERYYQQLQATTQSLRESEAKFRSLAEAAPAAIFIHQGGRFLYANAASESMIGYSREEFLSMDFWGVTHPDDRELVLSRGQERLAGGNAPQRYEIRIITKSGETRWVDMTAATIEYEGKPAVIGNAFDITARKHAEEEKDRLFAELEKATASLRESEEKFRTLAETTTAAIVIHQGQKLVYANTAAETMTGYGREELLSEDFWAVIHPDYQELVKERGKARLRGEVEPQAYEFKFTRKNGDECWATLTAGVIDYGGKQAVIGTLIDITEWKRAEEAKIKLYEESVRQYQERIEDEKRHRLEKEKILMDLHDGIGGITTNISILSEIAKKATDWEAARNFLSTISKLSREGISEIRSFMHSLDSKDLNWRTLAAELRSQGTNMVETHNITFTIESAVEDTHEQPGSLVWVNIFKVYKEALTNVIKHAKATKVAVTFRVMPESVLLAVEDNGAGLGKGRTGGRGLSHMRTRAEEIGGKVTVATGQGTHLRLELPLPFKYPSEGMVKL